MNNQIEIAAGLFKAIANNAKRFDRDIRKNPLAMKATIAAYADAKEKANAAEKGKNEIMRVELTKAGLGVFYMKDASGKWIQTPALKMQLSAISICADNALHHLSDADFEAMIAACDFEIASVRCFKDKFFAAPAKPKNASAPAPAADAGDDQPEVIETKTDTRDEWAVYENMMQVWSKQFGGNFWEWAGSQDIEKLEGMAQKYVAKNAPAKKAKAA